ncbi:MAG: aspartate ammonia-lyase [Candidatus Nanoarchaeia archaeon]
MRTRTEKDPLGKKKVPSEALYGVHTQRARENFRISGNTLPKEIFHAIALLKIAAAQANSSLKFLENKKANLIIRAAKEIKKGNHDKHLVIDAFQAGMGTPTHMNVNEVIANRALELAGKRRGQYSYIHPYDDVNMGQSTNNIVPSAIKIVAYDKTIDLLQALDNLQKALRDKSKQFKNITKSGRTHLQDAVPITLGQEFHAYATSTADNMKRLLQALPSLKELNAGRNAIGTGVNTHPKFTKKICNNLSKLTHTKWTPSRDPIQATQSATVFFALSSNLRLLANDLTKLANDLRLMSSGPRTGINELYLPAVEPGSSIMPGKINPSMAEMLNMVCFQVMGNDEAISLAAQAGQLELNVMMPLIGKNLLESIDLLTNAISAFTKRCVKGIKVNKKACKYYLEHSTGLATLLNPYVGYDAAAELVKEMLRTGKSLTNLIREKKLLSEKDLKNLLNPKNITSPNK